MRHDRIADVRTSRNVELNVRSLKLARKTTQRAVRQIQIKKIERILEANDRLASQIVDARLVLRGALAGMASINPCLGPLTSQSQTQRERCIGR
ncbi:hypothetical protein ACNJX9_32270 [Bradyrhizobium sp. DASA03076]|uniref:hypothetical protein n=1 Tax=Bradyrhizobium sp. BLXBL-03 TaxID=3395916 RepID=UPI003F7196EF